MQRENEMEIRVIKESCDRTGQIAMNQLLLRTILNIANGYEPESSNIIQNRYLTYQSMLTERLLVLQNSNNQI